MMVDKNEEMKGFKIHAVVTVFVWAILIVVNIMVVPEFLWSILPIIGMAIGLAAHYYFGVRSL
jgi:hypothetical protein